MAYTGFVVEIKELKEHSNADRLQLVKIFGTTVVVGLNVEKGDVMAYFPTDGQLNYDFALEAGLLREDLKGCKLDGYMDPKKRNVRAIRLRGERSDGILIPIEILESFTGEKFKVGDKIGVVGGVVICEKYIPKSTKKATPNNNNGGASKKELMAKKYPFFKQHIDTSQLAYNLQDFEKGDMITMTLKLHGTSQRTMKAQVEREKTLLDKILFRKPEKSWETITGTRRVILESYDGGYHGSNEFRKKWNDYFEDKLLKGETVYYELVGYIDEETTIMPSCNNKLLGNDFVKKYGEKTTFDYGLEKGQNDIYVYRMTMTNEDGHVVDYSTSQISKRCDEMGVNSAPVIEQFIYTDEQYLLDRVEKHSVGPDPIGKTHIKEGVVVRRENKPSFDVYKNKSFEFKVLEGIIKDTATEPDIEEAQ